MVGRGAPANAEESVLFPGPRPVLDAKAPAAIMVNVVFARSCARAWLRDMRGCGGPTYFCVAVEFPYVTGIPPIVKSPRLVINGLN